MTQPNNETDNNTLSSVGLLMWIKTICILPNANINTIKAIRESHGVCILQHDFSDELQKGYSIIINVSEQNLLEFCRKQHIQSLTLCKLDIDNEYIITNIRHYALTSSAPSYYKARKKHRKITLYSCDECISIPIMRTEADCLLIKGLKFSYKLPFRKLVEINKRIDINLKSFQRSSPDEVFNLANFGVGITPWYYRKKLYQGML